MNRPKNAGISLIEMVIALALLAIMTVPVTISLSQAVANQRHSVVQREAHGLASDLALAVRADPSLPNLSSATTQRLAQISTANQDLVYRVGLTSSLDISGVVFSQGDTAEIPPFSGASVNPGSYSHLVGDWIIVTAEVFSEDGEPLGYYLAVVNL